MKRVIEIDESIIEHIKDGSFGARPLDRFKLINADLSSIPLNEVLDKIIAEIDDVYENLDGYDPDSLGILISKVDEIIDKYKESED